VADYRLRVEEGAPFVWVPGQYVELYAPSDPDEALPYSIASAPDPELPNEFELAVGPGSAGDPLAELPAGSPLLLAGPYGQLLWPPTGDSALMIGVGTGVAPLRALVQATLRERKAHHLVLLCGFRTDSDILWQREFEALERATARLRYAVTLTQPSPEWRGMRGRVQEHALELAVGLAEPAVFLCGSVAMVQDCQRLLEEGAGVPADKIFAEGY
jgi:NAD(P)H-flavin reductase